MFRILNQPIKALFHDVINKTVDSILKHGCFLPFSHKKVNFWFPAKVAHVSGNFTKSISVLEMIFCLFRWEILNTLQAHMCFRFLATGVSRIFSRVDYFGRIFLDSIAVSLFVDWLSLSNQKQKQIQITI